MTIELLILGLVAAGAVGLVAVRLISIFHFKRKDSEPLPAILLAKAQQIAGADELHPVKYSSEEHFKNHFRYTPWQARGILAIRPGGNTFFGIKEDGELINLSFEKNESRVTFVEPKFVRDGGLSWFVIEVNGEKHYFTYESQPNFQDTQVVNNRLTTTGMYEALSDTYLNAKTFNEKP